MCQEESSTLRAICGQLMHHAPMPVQLRKWMAAAGMRTWADQMANVHGVVKGLGEDAALTILAMARHSLSTAARGL